MPTKKGFTLIELMVVVAIIAILSLIGITSFNIIQKNARDARRRGDINAISKAWESHYQRTSPYYPILLPGWFIGNKIPKDPTSSASYTYTGANEGADGDTYIVCAGLENGGGNASDASGADATSTNSNYYCMKNQQ